MAKTCVVLRRALLRHESWSTVAFPLTTPLSLEDHFVRSVRHSTRRWSVAVRCLSGLATSSPAVLGRLCMALGRLQKLDLRNLDLLTDVGAFSSCVTLQDLDLSCTPVGNVEGLSGMTSLTSLSLYATRVRDARPLAHCTALRFLNIKSTPARDLSPLSSLTGLHSLNLNSTRVRDVAVMSDLVSIKTLDIGNTKVADIASLCALSNLTHINCSYTPIADISALANCMGLAVLNLHNCQFITDIAICSRLTRLTELNTIAPNCCSTTWLTSSTTCSDWRKSRGSCIHTVGKCMNCVTLSALTTAS
jgi:hypothetical protein